AVPGARPGRAGSLRLRAGRHDLRRGPRAAHRRGAQAAHPLRVVRVLRERIRAMRRVILAVTGTIAGLVALLSLKSHVPSAPVAATAGGPGGTAASSSSSSSSSGSGQTEVVPGAFPQGSIAKNLPLGETSVDGKVASTAYGPVQIQLIKKNSKIVKV